MKTRFLLAIGIVIGGIGIWKLWQQRQEKIEDVTVDSIID